MRKEIIYLLLLVLLNLLFINSIEAGVYSTAGQSGLSFLKIGVGGRNSAMGDASVADTPNATAMYWNPAALGRIEGVDLTFMHNAWLDGVRYEYFAGARQIEEHALGFSIASLIIDDLEYRSSPTLEPEYLFNAYDIAITVGYARDVGKRFNFGFNAKWLYEKIDIKYVQGYAIDIGFLYDYTSTMRLGMNLQNIGPPMKYIEKEFSLPFIMRFGLSQRFDNFGPGNLICNFEADKPNDNRLRFQFGMEYFFHNVLALRGGYKFFYDTESITAGLGIKYHKWRFDYAFAPFKYDLGNAHRISLGVNL